VKWYAIYKTWEARIEGQDPRVTLTLYNFGKLVETEGIYHLQASTIPLGQWIFVNAHLAKGFAKREWELEEIDWNADYS